MFTDLHITDFRGITDLSLSGFNRVNLIVGENNTGKTTLLEALALVASPKEAHVLLQRFRLSSGTRNPGKWLRRDACSSNVSEISLSKPEQTLTVGLATTETNLKQLFPSKYVHHTTDIGGWRLWTSGQHPNLSIRTVAVQHREPQNLVSDFSTAVRSKQGEKELEELLHAVDNRIRAVRLDYEGENQRPYISADIGLSERVPIDQLGQGVNRLIAIFCELLGQRPAICFIDEIENGLHHSVLTRIWQGIAAVAERLDIQVFATTHSRECLEAAHECFSKRDPYDFRVIQLYRVKDQVDGRVLGRELIEAAVETEIEVR